MTSVQIGGRTIGSGSPIYLIAEAGSNHNRQLDFALRLIDVAAEAHVDAVKFQTFKASRMYPPLAGASDYLNTPRSIYQIIEDMEMPDDWVPKLAEYCKEKDVDFLSTPFDERSADLLAPHVEAFKIASYEMTHTPLLRHVARFGKPMIVSTGAATLEEVLHAVDQIVSAGNNRIVLMQCTARYPTPFEALNASAIVTLRQATGRPVGLSDHSRDPVIAPVLATALGANAIEKHFTLSNRLPGPDHQFAVEPDELRTLVRSVRSAELAMGSGEKKVLAEEQELHAFARRSVFTCRPIKTGEVLGPENIAVLRCGKLRSGIAPEEYDRVVGGIATRDLPAQVALRVGDWR